MAKILIADDDIELCTSIAERLRTEQHTVELVHDGNEAEQRLRIYPYDCVILDWNMPGVEGPVLCRNYRQRGGKCPILMLTGRRELQDKETGLDSGADDYLTKPFSVRELAARVRALLRRPVAAPAKVLCVNNISLNTATHVVSIDGKVVHLRPKEFAILELMLKNKNHVFSAEVLLDKLWSDDPEASIDSVRTAINRLRGKVDKAGEKSIIDTVHGRGYRLLDC